MGRERGGREIDNIFTTFLSFFYIHPGYFSFIYYLRHFGDLAGAVDFGFNGDERGVSCLFHSLMDFGFLGAYQSVPAFDMRYE